VHKRKIDEVIAAHTVTYADDWALHFRPESVDHMEQISRVIVPASYPALIQDTNMYYDTGLQFEPSLSSFRTLLHP
jgi:hypothetical protein